MHSHQMLRRDIHHGPTLWSTRSRCCICITDTRFTKRLEMKKFSVNSWSWFVVVEVGVLCSTSTPPSPPPITSPWSIPTVFTRAPLLRLFQVLQIIKLYLKPRLLSVEHRIKPFLLSKRTTDLLNFH